MFDWKLTRLLKHITGQKEQPSVQQQQMQPQNSHLTLYSHERNEKGKKRAQQNKINDKLKIQIIFIQQLKQCAVVYANARIFSSRQTNTHTQNLL